MLRSRFIFILLILNVALNAQHNYASYVFERDTHRIMRIDSISHFGEAIRADKLKEILYYLASDSCEGRELGKPGNDRAANFIAEKLNSYGIQKIGDDNTYFQHVGFKWISWVEVHAKIDGENYRQLWDFVALPTDNKSLDLETDEVVFLGYGIDDKAYSDYKNINLKNKTILIYKGEPTQMNGNSWISGSTIPSNWATDISLKVKAASDHGVKCILVIEDKFKELADANRNKLLSPTVILDKDIKDVSQSANLFYISSSMATSLLGTNLNKVVKLRDKIKHNGRPFRTKFDTRLSLKGDIQRSEVAGRNILAFIEGSDKKDEVLLITAHYDHIGKRGDEVFNGADDNGSGTATVTQIANAFQQAKVAGYGPRRSILCMLVTGEEKGLLGSLYYVNSPVISLNQTIADINIDMVGRIDDKYKGNPNYVYVIGSDRLSKELHNLNELTDKMYSNLTLDYSYNAESDPNRYYFRSDHYNFASKGVPAIFFFNGTHEDYHRPTDDVEKIDFSKMEKIGRHVFALAWKLANQETRLAVDQNP